ncbi:DUF397 domain-containing protein [Streptomyces chitinivorans]|uniref:DUF397 domain-containing protein n=1 Tax=Streptomyces chitinivorans TaxID=1257027 RepID=A0ABW7HZD9_9ACTN|nr:DUF397 domain-containing protein [Streptomyces chitinivorans]MDH2408001.1 DUF397 domain-containing protein [Streptomyces chitinivorans]
MSADRTRKEPADLTWRKSGHSGTSGGECVEVAAAPEAVHVRDSRDRRGPVLHFPADGWAAFVSYTAKP